MMNHHGGMASQNYPDLPPPPLMKGIGNASMKITTNSAEAQAYFDQGLRLLHDFWDFESYRAFKEAARLDPSAAMAYWGEFEALKMRGRVKDDTRAALDKAKSLMDGASDHERYYIRAAEHEIDQDKPGEDAAYQHEMEALINRYPDDQDAQALLALNVMNGFDSDGDPRPGELYSQALLRNLLAAHPESAAANHYWIHAVEDSSRPELALHSADVLASMAPNSGHMVHMPGHIYWRIGDYERARESFLASMHVDEAYMALGENSARERLELCAQSCVPDRRVRRGGPLSRGPRNREKTARYSVAHRNDRRELRRLGRRQRRASPHPL